MKRSKESVGSKEQLDSKTYKRLKRREAQQIRSETNDPALNKDGVLDVAEFVKSRKFEISELEKAQLKSKFASSTRTFQSLPRKLRRRTASHNVKRIPKRLRNRALREMAEEPSSGKGKKLKGKALYRARMAKNLLKLAAKANLMRLLPNSQALSMGKMKLRQRIKTLNEQIKGSKEKNSSDFIKINNNVGSYDNSALNALASHPIGKIKYMKRQRKFVWLTTHVWHAKRAHMIKRWGFQIPLKPTQKCFRLAHRNFNSTGGIVWDKSYIGTVLIQSDNLSSISTLLDALTKGKASNKRFLQNGSIYQGLLYKEDNIISDGAILFFKNQEGLNRAVIRLHPAIYELVFDHLLKSKTEDVELIDTRFAIGSIEASGPIALASLATILKPSEPNSEESKIFGKLATEGSLPDHTMFTFHSVDPRVANRTKPRARRDLDVNETLMNMKLEKRNISDNVIETLLTSAGRSKSYENQLSLKQVEALKSTSKVKESLSSFPIIIYKLNGVWTVLLPWYWVLPVWNALNHVAHINHAGLLQSHQLKFERAELFFPDDFPFTQAGFVENMLSSQQKRERWNRRPISKRINYQKLRIAENDYQLGELGDPFNCDWRYLQILKIGLNRVTSHEFTRTSSWDTKFEREIKELHDVYEYIEDVKKNDHETLLRGEILDNPIKLFDSKTKEIISPHSPKDPLYVITAKFEIIGRGNPSDCARVYSIPQEELSKWVKAVDAKRSDGKKVNQYPEPPNSKYLIGFITSGGYNLSRGCNTGVGAIDAIYARTNEGNSKNYCVIRNVGTSYGRLATWTEIEA